jgi:hypothetical protein
MTKLYKLTDENGQSYGKTQWGEGVTHSGTGQGRLCGPGWVHAYTSPLLAVLLNPIHAKFPKPKLWEAEGEVGLTDHGLKVGCKTLTTLREIPLPAITDVQRVTFAILCVKAVCSEKSWNAWADDWLNGKNRTASAAARAARAARAAQAAAEAWAAEETAEAAEAAAEAWAAEETAEAAEAAAWAWAAEETAAWAAARAAARAADVDLESLATQAIGAL